jgi:nucleoid-associated protein YgaU
VRASRLSVALGVIFVGLCAAWPFRQTAPARPALSPTAAPLALTLRRPDAPLELAPRVEVSPALTRERAEPAQTLAATSIASEQALSVANLAPPPAMPISFQPLGGDFHPTNWRPEPVVGNQPPAKPRPYRLRDGDTLERLAERFLGDVRRAEEIFAANRHLLARPDLLPVGIEIVIPPRQIAVDLEPVR